MKNNSDQFLKSSTTSFALYSEPSVIISVEVSASDQPILRGPNSEQIEDAVYGYIQAVRALGREKISVNDISAALSLPDYLVSSAVKSLNNMGVHSIK